MMSANGDTIATTNINDVGHHHHQQQQHHWQQPKSPPIAELPSHVFCHQYHPRSAFHHHRLVVIVYEIGKTCLAKISLKLDSIASRGIGRCEAYAVFDVKVSRHVYLYILDVIVKVVGAHLSLVVYA